MTLIKHIIGDRMQIRNRSICLFKTFSIPSGVSDAILIHSGEPVPVALVGPNVRCDDVEAFDEVSAAKGCLGFLKGPELMFMLLNYANRSCLLGHQLGERKRPCYPKTYAAFKLVE